MISLYGLMVVIVLDVNKKPVLTKQSKIVKYKLEEECVRLRREDGLSYQAIADELNNSDKVPADDSIDRFVVMRFLEKVPDISKEIISENRERMVEVVNQGFDIIHETNDLYGRAKKVLLQLEATARVTGRNIDPYRFKAVASEMREMLRQMMDIQKEINDYNNIRRFMEIILETLYEEVPDKIPIIIEKLKMAQGTQWFADIVAKHGRG